GATCSLEFIASGPAGSYKYVVEGATAPPTGGVSLLSGVGAPLEGTASLPTQIPFLEEATNHRFLYAGTGGSSFGTCHWNPDPPGADDTPDVIYSGATTTSGWDCCTFQFDGTDGVPSSVGQLVINLNGPLPPPDPDGDGFLSPCDSCDYVADPTQADRGGLGTTSTSNGIGDACECGELSNDGKIDAADVTILRNSLAMSGPALTPTQLARCAVIGNSATCNVRTVSVMRKALGPPLVPSLIQPTCTAALPP
ncbi:MAG: hypothetical protein ACRDMZ_04970, partial [Solirubrobacteraceae bacterium]